MSEEFDIKELVINLVEEVFPDVVKQIVASVRSKPYGIVKRRTKICYGNKSGDLVWDFLIFNEITFEDDETHSKISFGLQWNDKKTEEIYEKIVAKYEV